MAILKKNTIFADFKIIDKLSRNHDAVREVYLAKDNEGKKLVLTIYNLNCSKYHSFASHTDCLQQEIEEIHFHKVNKGIPGFANFINAGISVYRKKKYAWMAQEFLPGSSLESVIFSRGLSLPEVLFISIKLSEAIEHVARFTKGGGHYNISSDHIMIECDENGINDVRLIGFSHVGHQRAGEINSDNKFLDKRYQAPETLKGIFNHKVDIYSLGIVMIHMLTGYRNLTTNGCLDIGPATSDLTLITPTIYHKRIWEYLDNLGQEDLKDYMPPILKLILKKATNISSLSRFATIGKFRDFLMKINHEERKTTIMTEPSELSNILLPRKKFSSGEGKNFRIKVEETPGIIAKDNIGNKNRGFEGVAGMKDLKHLFRRDFIRILKNPEMAMKYGISPSNCTLLYGPQGCGKTFIAERAAQEAGLKYKIIKPSDLGSIYIHGAQQKIAETFAEAEKNKPMILIFDEFDAMVPKRDSNLNEHQANEVNEMLTQLNNCAQRGVYVLCTTNRPDRIDPAVMRKGRIDRSIYVALPDFDARKELFKIELGSRPAGKDIDYDLLALETENYTCSDISFIINETARKCFEETLEQEASDPIPLTLERIRGVIKVCRPSVSEKQLKKYLEIRSEIENKYDVQRRKVGFFSLT